jgi:hypothetical protein
VVPAEKRCSIPVKVIDVRVQPASGEPMHRFRRALTALFAGVIVTIATVGVAAPAQAGPDSQTNATDNTIQADSGSEIGVQDSRAKLRNHATGRCLQASSSSGAVVTRPCSTSSLQTWIVTVTGSNVTFKNVGNGWCLDGSSSSIYTHACNTGSYQKWYANNNHPSGGWRFMSSGTGKCLDSNSQGSVYPLTCNTGGNQRWIFQ